MTTPTQTLLERAAGIFGDNVLWVMPEAVAELKQVKNLLCHHTFRPEYLALQKMGVAVTEDWPKERFETIALCLPRQTEWACGLLARALVGLPPGGTLLMIAPNDLGGKKYAKLLEQNFGLELADSKHHCRIAVLKRPKELPPAVEDWRQAYAPGRAEGSTLASLPGTFSHGRVDEGSAILLKYLPTLNGEVADFGAGWGYLAHHVLTQHSTTIVITLIEADLNALRLAQLNLKGFEGQTLFRWADVQQEGEANKYDFVIMNPPFHGLSDTNPDIGGAFIVSAAKALKKGGQLWMVANAFLPYEEVLQQCFGDFIQVAKEGGYKVLTAIKT